MALNHSIKDVVFFYWLNLDALVILLLILSRIVLLILPISDLLGWISRQVGLLAKFGLWSFSVMSASLLAVMSTLSSMPSFVAMFLFSEWMARVVLGCAFLQDFVIFWSSRSLYVEGSRTVNKQSTTKKRKNKQRNNSGTTPHSAKMSAPISDTDSLP